VNPAPVTETEFTVSATVPVEDSVTTWVTAEFTPTLPKSTLELLTLNEATDAPSWSAKISVAVPVLAVRVAVCAEVTEATVALKLAVVVPAGTLTEFGTVTASLLLARLTETPPVAADAFNVTEQLSVADPVIEALLQVREVSMGTPVPDKLTVEVAPLEELLLIVNVPVAEPAEVGSNCTVSVAVWLGLKVSGKVAPETVNPAPAAAAESTVAAAVPVEYKVTVRVTGEFTFALPKLKLEVLRLSVAIA